MLKILIVDDDMNYRYAIREIIDWKALGFQIVDEAINGSQALRKLRVDQVDLVITDMNMPLMNGVDLIKKAKEEFPEMIFVALSAYDDFKFVRESLKEGAIDYILKFEMNQDQVEEVVLHAKSILKERKRKEEKFQILGNDVIQSVEIRRALVYLHENYQKNITLQTIADYIGLNKNYFSNLFKSETGENFVKYLNQLRIRKAVELLDEERKIKNYEIAERIGYQSVNYLSKMFKEIMGITIEDYKKMNCL